MDAALAPFFLRKDYVCKPIVNSIVWRCWEQHSLPVLETSLSLEVTPYVIDIRLRLGGDITWCHSNLTGRIKWVIDPPVVSSSLMAVVPHPRRITIAVQGGGEIHTHCSGRYKGTAIKN